MDQFDQTVSVNDLSRGDGDVFSNDELLGAHRRLLCCDTARILKPVPESLNEILSAGCDGFLDHFWICEGNVRRRKPGITYGEQHTARPLLTPDEVRNLPQNLELLFLAGQRPIVAGKLAYYADSEFRGLFDQA